MLWFKRISTSCLQETLVKLLEGKPSCYAKEIQQLHKKHQRHFSKWMLQLQWVSSFPWSRVLIILYIIIPKWTPPGCRLGFSVLVYGLGSKKKLLEDFRLSHLSQEIHLVVNGFFPSITLKSVSMQKLLWGFFLFCFVCQDVSINLLLLQILNALTSEVLEHQGSFRTPSDQIQYIAETLKDSKCVQNSVSI